MCTNSNDRKAEDEVKRPIRYFMIRFALSSMFLWVIFGTYFFPSWWLSLFTGEFFTWEGARLQFEPINLMETATFLFIIGPVNFFLARSLKTVKFKEWINSPYHTLLLCISSFFLIQSLNSLQGRAIIEEISPIFKFASSLYNEFGDTLNSIKDKTNSPPLSEPRIILFIDEKEILNLYSQYEDELVPTIVTQEILGSFEVKAGLAIDSVLKTEAEKTEMQKKATEYRHQPKTAQRKLKDLLAYLHNQKILKCFTTLHGTSSEITALNDALETLNSNKITFDAEQVSRVREGLLQEELKKFLLDLSNTDGLILVEGDWIVSEINEQILLTRKFDDYLSNPPECCVILARDSLPSEYFNTKDIAEKAQIRLTIFGSVITTSSSMHCTMRLRALAIY